jgi:ribosomal protein S18 acetylase RimI-like enzyme
MIIRAAHPADAPEMGRVMVETYLRAHKGQIPEEAWRRRKQEWTPEVSSHAWEQTLLELRDDNDTRECVYVAVDTEGQGAHQIIGMVMGGPSGVTGWEHAGDIFALYVRFEYHRRGVGRFLLQATFDHLRQLGMDTVIIRSLPNNDPANRFYESLGGQPAGECETEDSGYRIVERIYCWHDGAELQY